MGLGAYESVSHESRCVTYIDDVIVEEEPEAVRLDYGDVVAAVGPGAAVDDHSHQVIEPVRCHYVIRLKERGRGDKS